MNYFANPAIFQKGFNIPMVIAEKHLKIASFLQLRVILYLCANLSDDPSPADIASALSVSEEDVCDALKYWAASGVLIPKNGELQNRESNATRKAVIKQQIIKPTREEIARRGVEDERVGILLNEAQLHFGRVLKNGEISTLVWLLDDQGMEPSLILMLIEYAKSENRLNIGFIERKATEWINLGISDISSAESYIIDANEKKTAWKIVESVFGIESRMPSTKELDYAKLWIKDWGFSRDILRAAYERCVDAKSKFIMSYTAKILEKWHYNGFKSLEDIQKSENGSNIKNSTESNTMATYNISEIEKMLNLT